MSVSGVAATVLIVVISSCGLLGSDEGDAGGVRQSTASNETRTDEGAVTTSATAPIVSTTVASAPTSAPVAWDELPPANVPADLVHEAYSGRFLVYATVIEDGDGPTLCLPAILDSSPPQCGGLLIEGWEWDAVSHQEQAGSRWGEYVVTGRLDGFTFAMSDRAFAIDWSRVQTAEPDAVPNPPCAEPEGGWWADVTDVERLGSQDHNLAVGVVNTRPELVGIEIFEPPGPRPSNVVIDRADDGWIPGVLVVRLSEIRTGDEAEIRSYWGGPLCLAAVDGLNVTELTQVAGDAVELQYEISPGLGFTNVNVADTDVQVGVWIATVEGQAILDEEFGPGVVRLMGRLWAID